MATFILKLWSNIYSKMLIFWKNRQKLIFFVKNAWKSVFLRFSQKVSILSCMLLHNNNIDMTITNILHNQKSLYDHQGLRNRNSDTLLHWKILNRLGPSSEFQTSNCVSWISQLFRTNLVSSLTGIIDAFSNEIDVAKIILIGNQGIYVCGSFCLD